MQEGVCACLCVRVCVCVEYKGKKCVPSTRIVWACYVCEWHSMCSQFGRFSENLLLEILYTNYGVLNKLSDKVFLLSNMLNSKTLNELIFNFKWNYQTD